MGKITGINRFTKGWLDTRQKYSDIPDALLLDFLIDEGDRMAVAMEKLQRERDDYRMFLKGVHINMKSMLDTQVAFDGDSLQ